jgi:hypothetical protein
MEKRKPPIFLFLNSSFVFSLKNTGYISWLNPFADFFHASLAYRKKGIVVEIGLHGAIRVLKPCD